VTLKTGVIITINYIRKQLFEIIIIFHNITVVLSMFDQINAVLMSIRVLGHQVCFV